MRGVLDELHPDARTAIADALIVRAVKGRAAWKPSRPAQRIVDVTIRAMRVAAEKRVEGILGSSRRRHYGHAALLVASCLAFAPTSREAELSKWVADLRQQYSRRSAFREELTRAFASLGVAPLT